MSRTNTRSKSKSKVSRDIQELTWRQPLDTKRGKDLAREWYYNFLSGKRWFGDSFTNSFINQFTGQARALVETLENTRHVLALLFHVEISEVGIEGDVFNNFASINAMKVFKYAPHFAAVVVCIQKKYRKMMKGAESNSKYLWDVMFGRPAPKGWHGDKAQELRREYVAVLQTCVGEAFPKLVAEYFTILSKVETIFSKKSDEHESIDAEHKHTLRELGLLGFMLGGPTRTNKKFSQAIEIRPEKLFEMLEEKVYNKSRSRSRSASIDLKSRTPKAASWSGPVAKAKKAPAKTSARSLTNRSRSRSRSFRVPSRNAYPDLD